MPKEVSSLLQHFLVMRTKRKHLKLESSTCVVPLLLTGKQQTCLRLQVSVTRLRAQQLIDNSTYQRIKYCSSQNLIRWHQMWN